MLLCALMLGAILGVGLAQVDKEKLKTGNKKSPNAETSATVGGKSLWIAYHAPSVSGRKIFNGDGALQPDGTVWRLGADYATVLHTDADLDLNGLAVPQGDYTLYIDLDKGAWKLIVNKKLMDGARNIWGINRDGSTTDDPAQDVGRVAMTMGKPPALVETLKITLTGTGGNKGKIDIAWENVTASVPFTVKIGLGFPK
jgi:hypothetical protein